MDNFVPIYADGGASMEDPAMAQGGAPQGAPQGGGDPAADIQGALAQYAQSRDPQLAVQICDMLVEAMGAGAGAGAPAGPEAGGAPMGANGMSVPAYRNGGQIRYRKVSR